MAHSSSAVMPLYGFLEGDTMGLLILAQQDLLVAEVAELLLRSADVRVARRAVRAVVHNGVVLNPALTLRAAGVTALDRIDVRTGCCDEL